MPNAEPVPMRMIAVHPGVGPSGHIYVTTAGIDGGWDKVLMMANGWPDHFGRPYALDLGAPRKALAFDPVTSRVFATSRAGNLLAAYWDGDPPCAGNFGQLSEYRITVCVANPAGGCRETFSY